MTVLLEKQIGGYAASQKRLAGGGFPLKYALRNTYRAEIEDFSAAVLGRRKPLVNTEEALWNLRVCLAAYRAARTGKAVRVDPS